MTLPRDWHERDLLQNIQDQIKESLTLEYKGSQALTKDDRSRNELAKDVSAFANSAGGTIVYGIAEDNQKHFPSRIDDGVDPNMISKEWVEQVINSTIHPRIAQIFINQVDLLTSHPGRVAYVLEIPQSVTNAPHQAPDHKYYKRYNFMSEPMEDYEIRDIIHRAQAPDLDVKVERIESSRSGMGYERLRIWIVNRGSVVAKYVSLICTVLTKGYQVDQEWLSYHHNWSALGLDAAQFVCRNNQVIYPDLSFEAGSVDFKPSNDMVSLPRYIEVEIRVFAEGTSWKAFKLPPIPTGMYNPPYHFP